MGSSASYPQPTAEEKALQAYQLAMLKKESRYYDLLEPMLLAKSGYKLSSKTVGATPGTEKTYQAGEKVYNYDPGSFKTQVGDPGNVEGYLPSADKYFYEGQEVQYGQDAQGKYIIANQPITIGTPGTPGEEDYELLKMTDEERQDLLTPQELADEELARKYQERQLAALEGKLPISPAMEENIQNQKNTLSATLAAKLGPNWAATTPGIQAMTQFEQAAELVREEARRGAIGQGVNLIGQGQQLTTPTATPTYTSLGTMGSLYGGQQGRIPGILQPYQQQGLGQFQASMANQQSQSQLIGAGIGTVGMVGAAYLI